MTRKKRKPELSLRRFSNERAAQQYALDQAIKLDVDDIHNLKPREKKSIGIVRGVSRPAVLVVRPSRKGLRITPKSKRIPR